MRLTLQELDAMRELAKVGSGTAATALSTMIGLPVQLDVPCAETLAVADAIDRTGAAEALVTAIAVPAVGDVDALALILMPGPTVATLCRLLGVEVDSEIGVSALCEIGNIIGSSYLGALAEMTGLRLEPGPPERIVDMLGAILGSAWLTRADGDSALLLQSQLSVAGVECSPAVLFMPSPHALLGMLTRLGIGS